jgi:hypothetical protein
MSAESRQGHQIPPGTSADLHTTTSVGGRKRPLFTADDLNDYLRSFRDENDWRIEANETFPLSKRIRCVDGFSLSVQATWGAYCTPRRNVGPWSAVEVGFPSDKPDLIMEYTDVTETTVIDAMYGLRAAIEREEQRLQAEAA